MVSNNYEHRILYDSALKPIYFQQRENSIQYMTSSVRAMQYVLDMALNTKIPDDLVHKLSFECFRNWLQCLKRLWFNFKICGIFPQLSVVFTRLVFMRPFWSCDSWSGYAADKDSLSSKACQGKQQQILQIVMNHQSNQIETCKSYEYWSANHSWEIKGFWST